MVLLFPHAAPTQPYRLSLHDALPIYTVRQAVDDWLEGGLPGRSERTRSIYREALKPLLEHIGRPPSSQRSEEHTSELQSRPHLVCRLLLEKKKLSQSSRPSYCTLVRR